ncbi:DUF5719 family protein [Pseudarthrobacter sp. N5]|uniref:DUF5719 family protein n=1 Tax=Pseudarthrobacter sp. N5 TaxID=3418416 RepID=UPI003CF00E90
MHKDKHDGVTAAPAAKSPEATSLGAKSPERTTTVVSGAGGSGAMEQVPEVPDIHSAAAGGSSPAVRKASRGGVLAGVISAVLILSAGGGVVAAASLAPQSAGSRHLDTPLADVPAGRSLGVCPGPARLLEGSPVGTDPQFSPESATAKSAVSAAVISAAGGVLPGSRLAALDGTTAVEIAKSPGGSVPAAGATGLLAGIVSQRAVDAVSVLGADALGNREASAAAVMSYSATDGDLQGSAAAACQQPSNDLWLVGANTALGRTSVLSLINSSSTPATVSLELYGRKGQIHAPGSRGLLVAPGTTRSIVLAGLAPGEDQLSVHARSAGGPVAAVIQQSVLRGLTPGGVDFIAPGVAPASRQVMTGIDIQDAAAIKTATAKRGYADAGPALQITVPGQSDAVVEIRLFGRDGQKALPDGGVVTAKAGTVTEVPLGGVPAGHYTVSASSDVSFVAATRVTRGLADGKSSDLAWARSSTRLGSQHVVPVPQGGERILMFGALDNRATITYTAITADGQIRKAATADIAGGTTSSIKVPEKIDDSVVVAYLVSAAGDAAYGALLLEQDGREDVSTLAMAPGAAGQEKVAVTLGY